MENKPSATPKIKSAKGLGTDADAIASRLEAVYGNLHASSPRDVRKIIYQKKSTTWRFALAPRGLDANNNICSVSESEQQQQQQQQPKIKYELPSDYQGTTSCTCHRPSGTYECGCCHHYFKGRLSQICEKHPSESFLMDLAHCPYCMAPLEMIKDSPLSWKQIRKIEDAVLPSDSDL